jgi:hypothetical protein
MKLKELIKKLSEYNPEAKVNVISNNRPYEFSITYGNFEGCEKYNCDYVDFYVDETCESELLNDN